MWIISFYLVCTLLIAECVEEVPRASPMRFEQQAEIRRAPVYKVNGVAPRAKGFKRVSTGVRRSPSTSKTSKAAAHSPRMPHPLSAPVIPLPHMLPMNLPTVTFPPMMSLPTFPTFATIAMPTLPTITMPPSFQRLMGITTTSSPRRGKSYGRDEDLVDRGEESEQRPRKKHTETYER
ncbi:unnamed protein product [Strongylus vulgaris]|uniref:Uncharacterized protein n=1 Tax=Strongylus vulgaris TaxID=40348 RepID=A0A3P7J1G1_STRVU|nr:unnamed protein product [Strongylus vulgaris]